MLRALLLCIFHTESIWLLFMSCQPALLHTTYVPSQALLSVFLTSSLTAANRASVTGEWDHSQSSSSSFFFCFFSSSGVTTASHPPPSHNAEGFLGRAGVINVLRRGERRADDLLSCFHSALEHLLAGCSTGSIPHGDATGQDALNCDPIEGARDEAWAPVLFSLWRN